MLPMLLPAQGADQQSPAKAAVEKLTAELQKQNRDYRAARAAITSSDAYKAAVEAKAPAETEAAKAKRAPKKKADPAAKPAAEAKTAKKAKAAPKPKAAKPKDKPAD